MVVCKPSVCVCPYIPKNPSPMPVLEQRLSSWSLRILGHSPEWNQHHISLITATLLHKSGSSIQGCVRLPQEHWCQKRCLSSTTYFRNTWNSPQKTKVWPRLAHHDDKWNFTVAWDALMKPVFIRLLSPAISLPTTASVPAFPSPSSTSWMPPSPNHDCKISLLYSWLLNLI